jgi:hypothetical protein
MTLHLRDSITLATLALSLSMAIGCGQAPDEDVTTVSSALTYGNCPPFTDDQICACTDPSGRGECRVLGLGTRFYANISTITDLMPLNDKITSISVGANVRGKICMHPGWDGSCGFLQQGRTYDNMSLGRGCPNGTQDLGWGFNCLNDTVSSIRVDPVSLSCGAPPPGFASIAENTFLGGDCVVLPKGQYLHPYTNPTSGVTGGAFGLQTDRITSVTTATGTSISLFADPNFAGRTATFNGFTPDLRPAGMDDITSSINVF